MNYDDIYRVHNVNWTNNKVAHYWDWANSNGKEYFAEQVGEEIIKISSKYFLNNLNIIDYGCGDGFLINYLLKGKYGKVTGCDFSSKSVHNVKNKFINELDFIDCVHLTNFPSNINSNEFNCAFFLETIEHLLPEYFEPTINELNRILKLDGIVVLTTRNNEDLSKLQVHCPDCGATFHRVQHVNTFTSADLENLMAKFGFKKLYFKSTKLSTKNSTLTLSKFLRKIFYYFFPLPESENVNLIYIGKKITNL